MNVGKLYRRTAFHILRLLSISIGAVLGIFCNFGGSMYGPAPEYGMPYAEYKVSGTVLAFDNHEPVEGILVSIKDTSEFSEIFDSTKTDSSGRYSFEFSHPPWNNTWNQSVKDTDSTENGKFITKDTIVTIAQSELKEPTDNRYEGYAKINVDLNIDRDK